MVKLFLKIYDFLRQRRALRITVLIVCVIAMAFASTRMSVKEDIGDFLPSDEKNADVNWAFTHLNAANRIVITLGASEASEEVLSDENREMLMDAVDTLVSLIERYLPEDYIGSLIGRMEDDRVGEVTDFIISNLPYYMTEEDYAGVDSILAASLKGRIEADRAIVSSPGAGMMRGIVARDPLLISAPRLKALEDFKVSDAFNISDDYIFTTDGCALVTLDLTFGGSDTWRGKRCIASLDKAVQGCEAAFDGKVKVDPLGALYIAQTNSDQLKRDSILSICIAIVLIAVLLVVFFRSGKSILLVGVTIAFGFLTAFGCCALLRGSISLIVIGMGAVIIGIAANYPLHFLAHIKQGYTPRESLSDIVLPLTTGNITTVGAFLSLLFLSSPAMRDLGLFAALLLVGTVLFTLIFLPHLVPENAESKRGLPSWGGLSSMRLESNRWIILAVLLITVVLSFYDGKVRFESDLHGINYMTERQKQNMGRMLSLAQGDNNIAYIAVTGADMDEAIDNYLALLPKIDSIKAFLPEDAAIRGLRDFVPSTNLQKERIERWNLFVAQHRDELLSGVASAASSAGFRAGAFDGFTALLDRSYQVQPLDYFSLISDNIASGCFITDNGRCAVLTTIGTDTSITQQISDLLEGTDNVIVFDASTLTGEMVETLSNDFDKVLYICAFIVFILLFVSFGRIELALISFLPLTIGWIWILGIMAIFGINFNIVNIILATFIFGMGDDYTIFITEGAMHEHTYGRKMLHTYKSTIILSALIMFVGIGSLIVAKHPAMLSLAYVIIIGMSTVVLMALIVPPFFYKWLTMKKGRKRKVPVTLLNWGSTLIAFVIFLAGSLFISVAGLFLITFTLSSKRGKALYHRLLCSISGFIFRNVFFTNHHIETSGEDFSKPAIIVSNHQSHLDLMALLQLTPKMVVVTNKWVWNNPLYGILIRYADFCPVENLLTDDLEIIGQKIVQGYSVLVFPEGTRTNDGTIGRFHRGAFYMAEKFNLDILPVVLHGINDVLPKENLLLRKGEMSVKVLPRITPDDRCFGADYKERSMQVRRLMSDTLAGIAAERETADYFADRVIHNYIYKGAEIERSVRRNLRERGNYRELSERLPESGRVLFVEPALGEPSLICALVKKNLMIDAVITDRRSRLLASECAGVPANLTYLDSVGEEADYDMIVEFDKGNYCVK